MDRIKACLEQGGRKLGGRAKRNRLARVATDSNQTLWGNKPWVGPVLALLSEGFETQLINEMMRSGSVIYQEIWNKWELGASDYGWDPKQGEDWIRDLAFNLLIDDMVRIYQGYNDNLGNRHGHQSLGGVLRKIKHEIGFVLKEGSLRKRLIDHGCSLRNQSGVAIHRDPRRPRNPSMGPRTEPALSTSFRMPVRNGLPPHPRPSLVQPPNSYLPQLSTVDHLGSGASPAVTREDRFQPHPATLAENLSSEENNHWASMGHEQIPVASSPSIFVHRSDSQASHQAPLFGQFDNFNHANLPQSQTLRSSPHPMRDFNPSSDNFQAGINFHSQNVATDSDNAFCNSTPRSGGMTELSFYDDSIPHSLEENPAQDNGQLTRPINHASEYMHGGSFGTSTQVSPYPANEPETVIAALAAQVQALTRRADNAQDEKHLLETKYDDLIAKIMTEINTLQNKNGDLKSEIVHLRGDSDIKAMDLQKQNDDLREEMHGLQGENENLKNEMDRLSQINTALADELTTLKGNNVELNGKVSALQGHKKMLRKAVDDLASENKTLKDDMKGLNHRVNALKEENDALRLENKHLKNVIASFSEELDQLVNGKSRTESDLVRDLTRLCTDFRTQLNLKLTDRSSVSTFNTVSTRDSGFVSLLSTDSEFLQMKSPSIRRHSDLTADENADQRDEKRQCIERDFVSKYDTEMYDMPYAAKDRPDSPTLSEPFTRTPPRSRRTTDSR